LRTDDYVLHVGDTGFIGGIRLPAFGKFWGVEVVLSHNAH
jgi:hypothetical protein